MSDSESKRKYFSGRSVEQAVTAAASHYGIDPSQLKYREIDKRHGFVRTRRKAVIAVEPDDFRKAPEEARPPRRETAPPPPPSPPPRPPEAAEEEEREAVPRERERPPRRPEPREEDEGRREPRKPRREERREEAEPARTPWWHAQPVGGDEEEVDEEPAVEREQAPPEAPEEDDERQPAELRDERQPGRYRFVERSEGLRRREGAPGPAGGGEGGGRAEAPVRPEAPREERPRRDEARRGGRRDRGRRPGAEGARAGAPERGERSSRHGGGRGRRAEAAPPPEVAAPPLVRPAPRSERLPRVEGELAEAAQEALDMLFELTDIEAEADFFLDEERLEVELWGPDDHLLLQDDGQLLLAIEHLLPRMLRGLHGDTMPVRVDCNDFHFLREERLRDLALRTAGEVRRRGRPRTLDELDPAERRIVHLTLADDPDVTTDSIGDGFYKRVKVLPK